jgi:hypothetical protein
MKQKENKKINNGARNSIRAQKKRRKKRLPTSSTYYISLRIEEEKRKQRILQNHRFACEPAISQSSALMRELTDVERGKSIDRRPNVRTRRLPSN